MGWEYWLHGDGCQVDIGVVRVREYLELFDVVV